MIQETHYFDSTGEAYDATQCNENVRTGDILIIESEKVIGIADTWPVAATLAHGELHAPKDGTTLVECFAGRQTITPSHIFHALLSAQLRGWPRNRAEEE